MRIKKSHLIVITLLLQPILCLARPKVIYATDDRVEVSKDSPYYSIALSTAAMIKNTNFENPIDGQHHIVNDMTLGEGLSLCEGERFSDQLLLSDCSGTLVSPDVILTAGHCIANMQDCQGSKWVFNYNKFGVANKYIADSDVYSCQKILKKS